MNFLKKKKIKKVTFFKIKTFFDSDLRRVINGIAGNLNLDSEVKQIKVIIFNKHSVKNKLVTGNHRHKRKSNQWELLYIIGNEEKKKLIEFKFKNSEEEIKTKFLKSGDAVFIPPGCALGLLPLSQEVQVIEISNKKYSDNYEKINLFG